MKYTIFALTIVVGYILFALGIVKFISFVDPTLIHTKQVTKEEQEETISDLLETGYTVRTPDNSGSGSGTLFYANGRAYILTAGHVAEGCIRESNGKVVEEDKDTVNRKYTKYWKDATIEKTLFYNGKENGKLEYQAHVVAYSPAEDNTYKGLDLAVLELNSPIIDKRAAKFTQSDDLCIGERIFHVGSLWGSFTEAYVEGYVSRLDYRAYNTSFNIVKLGGCPGSSGGGIFKKVDGKYVYIGMLTRGDSGTTNLIKPSSIIRKFLVDNKLKAITR